MFSFLVKFAGSHSLLQVCLYWVGEYEIGRPEHAMNTNQTHADPASFPKGLYSTPCSIDEGRGMLASYRRAFGQDKTLADMHCPGWEPGGAEVKRRYPHMRSCGMASNFQNLTEGERKK